MGKDGFSDGTYIVLPSEDVTTWRLVQAVACLKAANMIIFLLKAFHSFDDSAATKRSPSVNGISSIVATVFGAYLIFAHPNMFASKVHDDMMLMIDNRRRKEGGQPFQGRWHRHSSTPHA